MNQSVYKIRCFGSVVNNTEYVEETGQIWYGKNNSVIQFKQYRKVSRKFKAVEKNT